jgi:hypothetical protein
MKERKEERKEESLRVNIINGSINGLIIFSSKDMISTHNVP